MKPRKAILTLAAVTALFSAGGCDLNSNVAVYGPPPDDYTTVPRPTAVQTTAFEPAQNIPEEVYGPPVSMEESAETAETSDTAETADTADTSQPIEEE